MNNTSLKLVSVSKTSLNNKNNYLHEWIEREREDMGRGKNNSQECNVETDGGQWWKPYAPGWMVYSVVIVLFNLHNLFL